MNQQQAIERACQEPTLTKALTEVAAWLSRVMRAGFPDCGELRELGVPERFQLLFEQVMETYGVLPAVEDEDEDEEDEKALDPFAYNLYSQPLLSSQSYYQPFPMVVHDSITTTVTNGGTGTADPTPTVMWTNNDFNFTINNPYPTTWNKGSAYN